MFVYEERGEELAVNDGLTPSQRCATVSGKIGANKSGPNSRLH